MALITPRTAFAATTPKAAPAQRVITLAPNLAQLVCDAGGCGHLVAVSAYTKAPPQAAQLPEIGNAWGFDYEAILAARPDLVLAWSGGTPMATVARLRKLGLKVKVVSVHKLDQIATALESIGAWLGTETAADRAAATYQQQLATLRARYASAVPVRVFLQLGTAPAYTVNADSPISAALAVCGGVNVFSDLPRIAGPVSAEAVLAKRPQIVLYGQSSSATDIKRYWSRMPAVPAQANGDIFGVDIARLTGTPKVLEGIRHVCQLLDRVRKQK